jgi:CheY-like chemotaxis protein
MVDINNTRILLADDELSILKLVPMVLKRLGNYNNITVVDNGRKALDELLNNHYALCITDTHMPGLKGYEVIQQYKASPNANGTKFVAMSGNFDSVIYSTYLSLGAALLSKPFLPQDLVSMVQSNLK